MLNRTTGLKRSTELRTRTQMPRTRKAKREKGLGQRVEATLGFLRPLGTKTPTVLRSEEHRRNVAALGCMVTGAPAQACHANFGKGMGLKACDSLCFPLCPELHAAHDQGGMSRAERRRQEWAFVDWTRAELLKKNLWPRSVEAFYQTAIQGLKRVNEQ